jgi:hypothetical protein
MPAQDVAHHWFDRDTIRRRANVSTYLLDTAVLTNQIRLSARGKLRSDNHRKRHAE